MITPNSTEEHRIKQMLHALRENDRFWIGIKNEPCFRRYTDHGGQHDQRAYTLYSDGRGMAASLAEILQDAFDTHVVHSYADYINRVEGFLSKDAQYFIEKCEFHRKYIEKRREQGVPIEYSVNASLSMLDEQLRAFDGLRSLVSLLKTSQTYKNEMQIKEEPMNQNITFNSPSNVQIGNHNIQNIQQVLSDLIKKIDSSSASEEEKKEAKSRLKLFLEHPLVTSIAGSLTGLLLQN